jgi:hypothetical protein
LARVERATAARKAAQQELDAAIIAAHHSGLTPTQIGPAGSTSRQNIERALRKAGVNYAAKSRDSTS